MTNPPSKQEAVAQMIFNQIMATKPKALKQFREEKRKFEDLNDDKRPLLFLAQKILNYLEGKYE